MGLLPASLDVHLKVYAMSVLVKKPELDTDQFHM